MEKRQFFKGLSWLLALNFMVKPIWIFLIDREVQNRVGFQEYGVYFALLNLSYVLLFVADAGMSNMMVKQIAADPGKTSTKQLLRIKLGLLSLYAVVCCVIGWLSGIHHWIIFLYVILIQALGSLLLFLRSLLVAHQYFKTDAFFSVADKSLMILLCSVFLFGWWAPINLQLFLQLQLLATAIINFILFVLLLKKKVVYDGINENLRPIAYKVFPFAIIILLMGAHYRLDGFLLERLHSDGAKQAGIYASAYRLLDAGNMLGYLCASFLVPFISRHQKNKEIMQQAMLFTRHGLLILSMIVVSFVFVFAPGVQQLLYHSTSAYNTHVISLCLAVLPAYYLVHVYGSALTAIGEFTLFIRILFFSLAANLAINLLLIPSYGALACCVAALVSQYGCALALVFFSSRKLNISIGTRSFFAYGMCAMIGFAMFFLARQWGKIVWIILALVCTVTCILFLTDKERVKRFFSVLNS